MEIGHVTVNGKLYLAPMAGVTDMAFRQICRELGADMSCTELVSAKALCYQDKKSRGLLKLADNERPAAAQIFGSDVQCMAEAAQIAAEVSGAAFIDINMGCPVGKVVANGDIFTPEDAVRILAFTGADMAMIGRGCFGNPWLFQQAQAALAEQPIPPLPPLAERWATAVRQVELSVADKGEHIAVLEARKQLCWYLKGVSHANYYKEQIVRMDTLEDVYRVSAGVQRDLR